MVLLGMYNGYQQVMIFMQHTARKHSYTCEKYDRNVQHCVNQDNNNTHNSGFIFLTFNKILNAIFMHFMFSKQKIYICIQKNLIKYSVSENYESTDS